MNLSEIETAIRQYFSDNWTVTDIAWPNRKYKPVVGESWVRLSILPGESFSDEIGTLTNVTNHRIGVLKIQIFTDLNSGSAVGSGYADQIETFFNKTDVDGIYFENAHTNIPGLDGVWFQHTVTCPFWAWI